LVPAHLPTSPTPGHARGRRLVFPDQEIPVRILRTALALTVFAATACGDDSSPTQVDDPRVESVTVTGTSTLIVGETAQMVVTILDQFGDPLTGSTMTWTSSSQSTASVSATGLVTALAPGSTTITASSGGVNGQLALTVLDVPVASITLDPESAEIMQGETVQLTATLRDADDQILTGRTITWGTSASSVATVASGAVTGVGGGVAQISATSGAVTAYAEVTVVDPCDVPAGTISVGETVTGTLTESSCFVEEWYHDLWLIELAAETDLVIDLVSTEFDAYLLLTDEEWELIDEDDDSGGDFNARLEVTLEAGTYIIWATTYAPEAVGDYELTVTAAGDSEAVGAARPGVRVSGARDALPPGIRIERRAPKAEGSLPR
jgi:hypothetical protein